MNTPILLMLHPFLESRRTSIIPAFPFTLVAVRNDRNKRRKPKQASDSSSSDSPRPVDAIVTPEDDLLITKVLNAHLQTFPLIQEDPVHVIVSNFVDVNTIKNRIQQYKHWRPQGGGGRSRRLPHPLVNPNTFLLLYSPYAKLWGGLFPYVGGFFYPCGGPFLGSPPTKFSAAHMNVLQCLTITTTILFY